MLFLVFLVNNSARAQLISKLTIKDTTYLSVISNYIDESKQLNFITDSLGIVIVRINTFDTGTSIDLRTIKQERASYFTKINVPSHYTFISGKLILFTDDLTPLVTYSDSYLNEVDKLTNSHFKKLEEDRGAFVKRTINSDRVVQTSRYLTAGNSTNNVTIRIYADGHRDIHKKI